MDRQALIDFARSLTGTPFVHEGRSLSGVDCYGFLLVIGGAFGIEMPVEKGYGMRPSGFHMKRRLLEYCNKVDRNSLQVADILHTKWADEPQHLMIVSSLNPLRVIHADGTVGKVVEHIADDVVMDSIRGAYRLRQWQD